MTTISLDDATLSKLVSAAILTTLTSEKRDELLVSTLAKLIEPQKDQYGRYRPTQLEQAFQDACGRLAQAVALKMLESDSGFQEKLRALLAEAAERVFVGDGREKTVKRLADAISAGMSGERDR